MKNWKHAAAATICGSLFAYAAPAIAQGYTVSQGDPSIGDIVVTARKRQESLIDVPVAITAVSGAELEKRGVNSMDGLARLVPQLIVAESATGGGGSIVIRGISGSDGNPFADQAVSFNIDGVQVARATVRRMGQMDMQQVEVLKGPQALFYGKNSPGGVISIRTGDPTKTFEGKASVGYEFNAHEWRGEGYVAGPITEDLGFRIAAYGSKMRGWVRNTTPRSEITAPRHQYAPRSEEFLVRGTLMWEPTDNFDARLKVTYGEIHSDGFTSNLQLVACPGGAPLLPQVDNCRADDQVSIGARTDNFALRHPPFGENDGQLRGDSKQALVSYEMNYRPSDVLTLTSVTGLFYQKSDDFINVTATYLPANMVASHPTLSFTELSEELRLTSNFDEPVNFMIGGHFQTSKAKQALRAFFNGTAFTTVPPLIPLPIANNVSEQKGRAYSAFMQMQWDITEQFELSAGGRYSYEKKSLPVAETGLAVDPTTGLLLPRVPILAQGSKDSWNDFSPEVTLSYHPDRNLNIYGSYKHGFISGGYNGGAANPVLPVDYDQQTVKGFEAGAKASLLGGDLRTSLSLYTYEVKGLQVTISTGTGFQELKNVGKVRSKGGEFDFSYRTPLEGLSLRGAVAYNKARYLDYFANCYRGQTKALGCSFVPVPGGQPGQAMSAAPGQNGSLQDLAGGQVVRAPEWTGNVGFDYDMPVGAGMKLGLSTNMTFSASYFSDPSSTPYARVPNYQLFDATLRLAEQDDRWEIALIGRNLTDEYYWARASGVPFTGTAPGNETGPAVLADYQGSVSRGREVMLRVSTRF
ncbi:TonB-dependent receptor [Rhizorhapis suberifaciens]|uniref:Iron complex outermembrane receptor protein n=1 Tax=Rhizorhapis suberifaciens TaxID=13656 RepID=A0A840HSC9_9SPHN|nr:TonB-dependent receptor [Rhizorhapis suberifaciens]MBB4640833.1 iron complex outermembrane receptor protein [Rhizorhapis suberifaciens]